MGAGCRRWSGGALLVFLYLLGGAAAPAQQCEFRRAFERPDERGTVVVPVYEGRRESALGDIRPLAFITTLKVNTDGTKISYHRDDPRARELAINSMLNAMHRNRTIADFEAIEAAEWPLPRTWQVLSDGVIEKEDGTGKPCVTDDGYLISMTADVSVPGGFNRTGDCDPSKWIDALTIPAIVLPSPTDERPSEFHDRQARTRSPVVVVSLTDPRRIVFATVGDMGPDNELGEASVELNRMLNGLPAGERPANYEDAKERFQGPRSLVLIFPGSAHRLARPITPERVRAAAEQAFASWGGEPRLNQCLTEIPEASN
jgi:hypothetical protein